MHAVVLVSLNQNAIQVNENDGSAQVCVDIVSGSANRALTINLATNDITASSGKPFQLFSSCTHIIHCKKWGVKSVRK